MSRSKHGSKGPGFDYWGRRGIKDKDTVKGIERTAARNEIAEVMQDPNKGLPVVEDEEFASCGNPRCEECGDPYATDDDAAARADKGKE